MIIDRPLLAPVSVQNSRLRLDWSGTGLTATLRDSGILFRNADCLVERFDGSVCRLFSAPDLEGARDGTSLVFSGAEGGLRMHLECWLEGSSVRLSMEVFNESLETVELGDVVYLQCESAGDTPLLANPADVFSLGAATGETGEIWATAKGNKRAFALRLDDADPCYVTDNFLAVRPVRAGEGVSEMTLSFDRISEAACGFVLDLEAPQARARVAMRGAALPPGERRVLPTLTVEAGLRADQALEKAVHRICEIYRPPVKDAVPTGWCSWYYFYERVTENDILANVRFLAENRQRFPWQVVQIDDGYQRHWGDWLQPGSKFPHDMAWLAREIKKAGFRPGIWVAPLIMTAPSQLYRAHPEWALRRFENGEPWTLKGWSPPEENPWIILDGTHPEYLAYVREVFSVMAHDWGYDYFKIDATAFGAFAGRRHDPTRTGIQAVRQVVETIRAAIGPDRYLLGCGLPFGAGIGLVNGERVSDDVSTAFRPQDGCCPLSVALPQTIHRSFLQGKWWHNDPDCVLVRAEGTPHNPSLSQHGLTGDEARLMVTVVGLTQGIQMVGEDLATLSEDRLALLDAIRPAMPVPARPLDLLSPKPARLLTVLPQGRVLALLNWSDQWQNLPLGLDGVEEVQPLSVYEVWTHRFLGVWNGCASSVEVPPHGARLLLIRPAPPHPSFLGFDGHVSGGAALLNQERWDRATGTLHLDFTANRPGRISLRAPAEWRLLDRSARQEGEQWSVPVERGSRTFALRFARQPR